MNIKPGETITITVGFPKANSVTYPGKDRTVTINGNKKTFKSEGGQSVAQVAVWNNFGTNKKTTIWNGELVGKTPPRPFFTDVFKNQKDKIKELVQRALVTGTDRDFNIVGDRIKTLIQDSMKNGNWKENASLTKLLKKSERPLIDTGLLYNSVTYSVTRSK